MSSSTPNTFLIFFVVLIGCISWGSAFFLNWGTPEPAPPKQQIQQPHSLISHQWPVTAYYQQRLLQPQQSPPVPSPTAYTITGTDGMQIPAIPIQVPLQAQLAPAGNIHNVQLVPCLCPVSGGGGPTVSPDSYTGEYEHKAPEASVFLGQFQQQQQLQQQAQQQQLQQQAQQQQLQQQAQQQQLQQQVQMLPGNSVGQ